MSILKNKNMSSIDGVNNITGQEMQNKAMEIVSILNGINSPNIETILVVAKVEINRRLHLVSPKVQIAKGQNHPKF